MSFFNKKYCDICNEKIGVLGNKKLDDGNMCKNCAKKLSPWFSDRRNTSLATYPYAPSTSHIPRTPLTICSH